MRSSNITLVILGMLAVSAMAQKTPSPALAQNKRMVIAASSVLDGKGHVLHDARIVVEGSKIVAVDKVDDAKARGRATTTCAA